MSLQRRRDASVLGINDLFRDLFHLKLILALLVTLLWTFLRGARFSRLSELVLVSLRKFRPDRR